MAKKDPQGNWITADGNTVPPRFVGKIDKTRDAMVERIVAKAKALNQQIAAFDGYVDCPGCGLDVDRQRHVGYPGGPGEGALCHW